MLSVSELIRRANLLWALAKTQWKTDTAYLGNNIISLVSTTAYIGSFIIFISVLFDNVTTLGGYSKDEMLFLVLVGQVSFYLTKFWGYEGNAALQEAVNTGRLDFLLLRPVKPLFLVTFGKIKILDLLLNLIGPLAPTWLVINWSNIHIEPGHFIAGIAIMFMGNLLLQSIQFILTLPVFWTGRSQESNLIVFAASSQYIPLEGMPLWFKFIFTGFLPTFIATAVTASVMLGKADPVFWLAVTAIITLCFLALKRLIWSAALRQYVSASS